MQTRFRDGTVLVIGSCARDAELEYVGEDCKRVCRVGLAVGRRPVPGGGKADTVWCNVQAWHNLAAVLSAAKKGDPVLVAGSSKPAPIKTGNIPTWWRSLSRSAPSPPPRTGVRPSASEAPGRA